MNASPTCPGLVPGRPFLQLDYARACWATDNLTPAGLRAWLRLMTYYRNDRPIPRLTVRELARIAGIAQGSAHRVLAELQGLVVFSGDPPEEADLAPVQNLNTPCSEVEHPCSEVEHLAPERSKAEQKRSEAEQKCSNVEHPSISLKEQSQEEIQEQIQEVFLSTRASGPEKKGDEIRSEQTEQPEQLTGQELPAGAQLATVRLQLLDECPERPEHIPAGHPDDPTWAWIHAHPDFPWGGPYAPKPPADPPAVATRLPLPVDQLPPGLQPIADRIEAYWLGKGGARSDGAFTALIEELQLVLPAAGRSGVLELLRHAAQAGWPALNARAWLSQRSREPDLSNHPAYRTFIAA